MKQRRDPNPLKRNPNRSYEKTDATIDTRLPPPCWLETKAVTRALHARQKEGTPHHTILPLRKESSKDAQ